MNSVPAREINKLDGAIVPQLFIERDGDIYFFDKINLHEGRFCRYSKGEVKIVLEVGEGQGMLNHIGDIYLLQIGHSTVISKYNLDGQIEKTITMDGIFFDFKLNESGYFVLLGYVDNETTIKILNHAGLDAGFFKPQNILFGSCIGLYGDDIYLGGFDEENVFLLISMNYLGLVQSKWSINIDSEDRIIGKIQKNNNQILLHIVGKYDSLVILNMENGSFKEIFPCDLGLRSFVDANMYGDSIKILDEKCIYTWNINDVLNTRENIKKKSKDEDFKLTSYQYLMYLKGLEKELIGSLGISLILMSVMLGYLFFNDFLESMRIYKFILLAFSCFWLLNLIIASSKNLIGFMDKSKRIEELLSINSLRGKNSLTFPFFAALTSASCYTLFMYPNFNIYVLVLIGLIFSLLSYALVVKLERDVMLKRENVSIELLSHEDLRFGEYLRAVIEKLKNRNCKNVFVVLSLKKNINREVMDNWVKSRKAILGVPPKIITIGKTVRAEFDFSLRDIKYSRYSLLMDYICYIERETDIEEIQIGLLEDKE